LKREIITTADGSSTIHLADWDETYHSRHGAIQEAYHVFIKNGLSLLNRPTLSILEIGFGTGLNAFITLLEGSKNRTNIHYTGVEAHPVVESEIGKLNYLQALHAEDHAQEFNHMHRSDWERDIAISTCFVLRKQKKDFATISDIEKYDLVYYDAFGARVQPELWTEPLFLKMFNAMKSGGVLVTYAAKGSVRRAMQSVGFKVERLPGPPGKREMLRATKP
jgi:tRNA U34 5-methylaminomethyl-2-thiouridine-forming methyltransferase MnmC